MPIGTKFTGVIGGTMTEGRINKERDSIYLCQNTRCGEGCYKKLGYKYSWRLDKTVIIESLTADPEFDKPKLKPILHRGDEVEFGFSCVKVGKETIANTTILAIAKELRRMAREEKK